MTTVLSRSAAVRPLSMRLCEPGAEAGYTLVEGARFDGERQVVVDTDGTPVAVTEIMRIATSVSGGTAGTGADIPVEDTPPTYPPDSIRGTVPVAVSAERVTARPFAMRLFDEPGSVPGRRAPRAGAGYEASRQVVVGPDGEPEVGRTDIRQITILTDEDGNTHLDYPSGLYDLDRQIRVALDGDPLVWSAAPESSTFINNDGSETDITDPYN